MKKISILLSTIILFFGCVESELIIPGENIGGGNVGGETPTTSILKTFDYETPFYDYQFNYNQDGLMTQTNISMEILGEIFTGGLGLTYNEADLISQINTSPEGMYSNQSNLIYNDQNQLIEINADTTPETKFSITDNGNTITAVRTIDGVEENTFNFTKDSFGYINSYSFTDNATGDNIQVMFNMAENLITSNSVMINGATVNSYTYSYDNKINPLFNQTIDYFNDLMLNDAFEFDAEDAALNLDAYAMYRSANNITEMSIQSPDTTSTLIYEYQYNAADMPQTAIITVDGEASGVITYTYY